MKVNGSIVFGGLVSLYALYAYSKIGTLDNPTLQLIAFVGFSMLFMGVLIPFLTKENKHPHHDNSRNAGSWIVKAIKDDLDVIPFLTSMAVLFIALGTFYFFNVPPKIGVPIAMLLFLTTFFIGLWFIVKNKSKQSGKRVKFL